MVYRKWVTSGIIWLKYVALRKNVKKIVRWGGFFLNFIYLFCTKGFIDSIILIVYPNLSRLSINIDLIHKILNSKSVYFDI